MTLLNSTQSFYDAVSPMVNQTFSKAQTNYKNAYTIFDVLNVASIHNATFQSSSLLTSSTLSQLRALADSHEFALAYNSSDPIRAITGAVTAAEVVNALNATITSASAAGKSNGGAPKVTIQFGAYAGMLSFFGLAKLTATSEDFYGVPDYASSLSWELLTNSSAVADDPSKFPSSANDISVRFLFHNGTTSNFSEPIAYPLFGQDKTALPWSEFVKGMNAFSISGQRAWCDACGNSTGVCAPLNSSPGSSSAAGGANGSGGEGGRMSKAVAGVIGAMVTLALILLVELAVVFGAGLRVVRKGRRGGVTTELGSPDTSFAKA